MPSWIKKASTVAEEGQMQSQQKRLEERMKKIKANDITAFKIKNIGAKVEKKGKKTELND